MCTATVNAQLEVEYFNKNSISTSIRTSNDNVRWSVYDNNTENRADDIMEVYYYDALTKETTIRTYPIESYTTRNSSFTFRVRLDDGTWMDILFFDTNVYDLPTAMYMFADGYIVYSGNIEY